MMKMGTFVVAFGAIEKTISQRKKSLKPKPPHGRAAGSGSGRVPSAFGWQLVVTGGLRVGAAGLGASMAERAGPERPSRWRSGRGGQVQIWFENRGSCGKKMRRPLLPLALLASALPGAVSMLELLEAKPDALSNSFPEPGPMQLQRANQLQGGAGRPLAPEVPGGRPLMAAAPTSAGVPAAPVTNLQGALRMSMGSLMGFCRCEGAPPPPPPPLPARPPLPAPHAPPPRVAACESVLGDLIDNLEDDFPGRQYTEGDIYALINDRFCYGVKWVFRSPCRYILQKYMDEVIELIMVEATEREICEQLRFCW